MSSSDGEHSRDFGRKDSERRMQNRPTTTWMDGLLEGVDRDCEELLGFVEEEKVQAEATRNGFLTQLDAALKITDDNAKATDRKQSAEALLQQSARLLKQYDWVNDKIAAAFDDQADTQALAKKFEQDREHLKQVLLKGKQVQEGEMATVQQRAGVDDEVLAQAEGIFGRKEVSGDGVDRSLEYLERGVKRIIKGME